MKLMNLTLPVWLTVAATSLSVMSCSDDDTSSRSSLGTLSLALSGLEDLGAGFRYEGWLIVDGSPVTTGIFSVDAAGLPSATDFEVPAADLEAASLFVLTIEPHPDPDTAPSATHVLAGDFSGESASLSIGHGAALGSDFQAATGSYILETPSTATDGTDFAQGIWWLDPSMGPGASLTLPPLPEGWIYEGWIAGNDGPVSTGTFTTAGGFDSDAGGTTAGPDGTPPFPGQDFISPALSLPGMAAVISVEPSPDNSAAPFALKPLLDAMIEDVGPGVLQSMSNNAANAPSGTATR